MRFPSDWRMFDVLGRFSDSPSNKSMKLATTRLHDFKEFGCDCKRWIVFLVDLLKQETNVVNNNNNNNFFGISSFVQILKFQKHSGRSKQIQKFPRHWKGNCEKRKNCLDLKINKNICANKICINKIIIKI